MRRSTSLWRQLACALVAAAWLGQSPYSFGQFFGSGFNRSVGGVAVDAQGVLEAPTVEDQRELAEVRARLKGQVPADLEKYVELRAVSLKQVEAALAAAAASGKPVPDEVKCLAGLQRVRYVFVYPEQHDIVLAGPAEGWKVDALGNVVGATTNRPVLMLDDLIVALRSGAPSRTEAITCSIDPTPEGLQRVQALANQLTSIGDQDQTLSAIENSMGPQMITVTGVAPGSHFARAMVAADFRMKRLAMNFEQSPVGNMPSYLSMLSGGGRGMSSMTPRWWLAPNYQPLAKTHDGLAWELRGPGVKCLTEEDYVSESGQVQHSGKASPAAAKWATSMTENFEELAGHDSAFGAVRNIMDLAVIGALIEKEQLAEIAGLAAPQLMSEAAVLEFPVPRTTSSKASLVRARRGWVISASGGVEIVPWQVADRTETIDAVGDVRAKFASTDGKLWRE